RNMPPRTTPNGGGVTTAEPATWQIMRAPFKKKRALATRGNRIAIRHSLGTVVSVIEIVSPGNKSSRAALKQFVDKSIEFLDADSYVYVPLESTYQTTWASCPDDLREVVEKGILPDAEVSS